MKHKPILSDVQRFRTDPDYRRELMQQSFKRFDERSQAERDYVKKQLKEFREYLQERQRRRAGGTAAPRQERLGKIRNGSMPN